MANDMTIPKRAKALLNVMYDECLLDRDFPEDDAHREGAEKVIRRALLEAAEREARWWAGLDGDEMSIHTACVLDDRIEALREEAGCG